MQYLFMPDSDQPGPSKSQGVSLRSTSGGWFRRFGHHSRRWAAWCLLGALFSWSVSVLEGWIAPTPYTHYKFLQTQNGVHKHLEAARPATPEDVHPITHTDGSITGIGVKAPVLVGLPSWPTDVVFRHARRGALPPQPPIDRTPQVQKRYYADVYGWPMGSAATIYSRDVGVFQVLAPGPYELEMGWELEGWRTAYPLFIVPASLPRAIPLLPWPGIFIDGPLYGLTAWLLVHAARLARGRIRTRRGLCPRCAYPVGASTPPASPVCSECGYCPHAPASVTLPT